MKEANFGVEPKDNTVPIEEVFTHAEINRMKFVQWRLKKDPEDHLLPIENIEEWQAFRRGELIHRLGRR